MTGPEIQRRFLAASIYATQLQISTAKTVQGIADHLCPLGSKGIKNRSFNPWGGSLISLRINTYCPHLRKSFNLQRVCLYAGIMNGTPGGQFLHLLSKACVFSHQHRSIGDRKSVV